MIGMQTVSGAAIDLAAVDGVRTNPQAVPIRIADIAHALANLCRFGGHTREFYSVAQHSVHVSLLVDDRLALHALLHDAHEAYRGDVIRPIEHLQREVAGRAWRAWCTGFDEYVERQLGLPWIDWKDRDAIKHADLIALATERRDLLAPCPQVWGDLPEPDGREPLRALSPAHAYRLFCHRYTALTGIPL